MITFPETRPARSSGALGNDLPGDAVSTVTETLPGLGSIARQGASQTAFSPDSYETVLREQMPKLEGVLDDTALPALHHVLAALILERVYTESGSAHLGPEDIDRRIQVHARRMSDAFREFQPGQLSRALTREIQEQRHAALHSLDRGFRTDLGALQSKLDELAGTAWFGRTPDASSRLGHCVYESALRRRLEDALHLTPGNPLLMMLMNTRGEDYAAGMLQGLGRVASQLETGRPFDASQLRELHEAAVAGCSHTPFDRSVSFAMSARRGVSPDGLQETFQTLAKLNQLSTDCMPGPHAPQWELQIDGFTVLEVEAGHYHNGIRQKPLAGAQELRIARTGSGSAGVDAADAFINRLLADYGQGLEAIRQHASPGEELSQAIREHVIRLVQDLERAHVFADGNSRVATGLVLNRLLGELPDRGIHCPTLNEAHLLDDTWIDMLSAREASGLLRPLGSFPALPPMAGQDRPQEDAR